MPEPGTCRSCGAPLLWARSAATNALICLDDKPVPDGNVAIVEGHAVVLRGDLFEEHVEGPRYKSHFATCGHAAKHRRKK